MEDLTYKKNKQGWEKCPSLVLYSLEINRQTIL